MLPPTTVNPGGASTVPETVAPGCITTLPSDVAPLTRTLTNSTAANAPDGDAKSTVAYVRFCRPVLLKLPLASVVVLPPPLLNEIVIPGIGVPVGVCT